MTGIEIIEWAVRKCAEEKIPPTDSAIVRMLRYHLIDSVDVRSPYAPTYHSRPMDDYENEDS